jgi:hypothetical protein
LDTDSNPHDVARARFRAYYEDEDEDTWFCYPDLVEDGEVRLCSECVKKDAPTDSLAAGGYGHMRAVLQGSDGEPLLPPLSEVERMLLAEREAEEGARRGRRGEEQLSEEGAWLMAMVEGGGGGGGNAGVAAGTTTAANFSSECVVCLDAAKTHLFVPCGHQCVCESCSRDVMAGSKQCPMCRSVSSMAIRHFA